MGELIRKKDWSETSLGAPGTWPQSLRTSVSICLNSRFPILLWWGKDYIKIYNDAYRDIIGTKHPKALGAKGKDVWPEIWPIVGPMLESVFEKGEATWSEDQQLIIERNGYPEECYFTFSYSPIYNEIDVIVGIFCAVTETTNKVRTEQHLKKQLSNLFVQAPVALSIFSGSNHVIEVANELMLELWGRKIDEVINKPAFEAMPDVANQGFEQLINNVYNTGERFVAQELPVDLLRNGKMQTIFVKFVFEALRQEDGTIYGVMGVADDVTESVLARKKIEENEERLGHAVESGRLGTYELDIKTGKIIYSPRFAGIFGLDASREISNEDLKNAIHPEDAHIRKEAHTRAKATGILSYEARVVWHDGSIHWVSVNGNTVFDEKGNDLRTYGTALDITKQKNSEEVLKESEQKLRLIADAIPHMVWEIEPDGRISYINKQWTDWSGLTLEEINNGEWIKVFHAEDFKNVADDWQKSMEKGIEYFGEYRIRDHGGNYYWFMGKTVPIKNNEGRIIKWIGTTTNIDEQKKVQVALKESEEQFRELADSMPQIVWTARPDGYIDYYNKKWYDFTGLRHDVGGDESWEPILHPDDIGFCRDTWYNAVRTGQPYHIEYRFKNRKKPGTYCWYLGKALPIRNSEGKIIKWYGSCTDINDQKEIEALLKDSEEKFRLMADSVPQQVWTAAGNGALDYVNQRIINYFGKSSEEIIGEGWQQVIHPDDLPTVLESWTHSLKTFEAYQVEFRLRGKNNQYRWHLARATPFFIKDSEVKWFGTNTDIEEHKFSEQKKDEFISIASHELKTPITSLKGIVYILNQLLPLQEGSQEARLLLTMDNQLSKLTKLVGDLLDVNKIDGAHLQLNKEDFDFRELISETVESVQHISPKHLLTIESNESVLYSGDKLRLEQVITNLLTNAVKYSPEGEKVIIRYDVSDENIIVSVQDFGIGIERENITKLFDRFYRVNNSLRFGGLGLGLYISANIIKAHNGNFWIESEVGKGSTFYFLLPQNKGLTGAAVQTDNFSYYADEQVKINYSKENKWIEADWTGFQNLESVQRGCLVMLDLLKKNKCTKVLNDNTHVVGNWSEASEWGGNIWFPQMQNAGLQYFAWVYSPSTFSQLAAEKSINIMAGSITSQFFNDCKEAEMWLKEVS